MRIGAGIVWANRQRSNGGGAAAASFVAISTSPDFNTPYLGDVTATSPTNDIYVGGVAPFVGERDISLAKFAPDGTLTWRYTYPHVSALPGVADPYNGRFADIAATSDGGCVGAIFDQFGTANEMTIIKFNADGDIEWQKPVRDTPTATNISFGNLVTDASDNIIFMFHGQLSQTALGIQPGFGSATPDNDSQGVYIAKYDPTGTLIWERGFHQLRNTESDYEGRGALTTDSAGNVYSQWIVWDKENIVIAKLAAADGSILWDTYYSSTADPYYTGFANLSGLAVSSDDSTLIQLYDFRTTSGSPASIVALNATTGAVTARKVIDPGLGQGGTLNEIRGLVDVQIDPATDLAYILGYEYEDDVGNDYYPTLLVVDLALNLVDFRQITFTPISWGFSFSDFADETFIHRGPRISLGDDNINFAFGFDQGSYMYYKLYSLNKSFTGIADGPLVTPPDAAVDFSITSTGATNSGVPVFRDSSTALVDGWAVANAGDESFSGQIFDISGDLEVTYPVISTFGAKVAFPGVGPVATTVL